MANGYYKYTFALQNPKLNLYLILESGFINLLI